MKENKVEKKEFEANCLEIFLNSNLKKKKLKNVVENKH